MRFPCVLAPFACRLVYTQPGRFHVPLITCIFFAWKNEREERGMFDHVLFMHFKGWPIELQSQKFRVVPANKTSLVSRGEIFPAVDHHLLSPQPSQQTGKQHRGRGSGRTNRIRRGNEDQCKSEMGETLLRNSELQLFLGAGIATVSILVSRRNGNG